jgi:antirestriction protein ArdC
MRTSDPAEKLSPAQRVTRSIEAALARGVRPWAKPWRDDAAYEPLSLPRRANGQFYRGMNVVALWAAAAEAGYQSPYWFTFWQALALGAQVRKGERGAFVVFYKELKPSDDASAEEGDRASTRRILRGYVVFNHAQIEGLIDPRFAPPAPIAPPPSDDLALRFAKVPAVIRFGGSRAFYSPSADFVQLPPKTAFIDHTQFYATLAHELGHWTRHPTRLARDFGQKRFGDAGYALEELTAELCAAFVGAVIGLPGEHIEDHAAYIGDWLKALKDNPSAFLTAAAKAQLAADYLLRLMGEAPASEPPED